MLTAMVALPGAAHANYDGYYYLPVGSTYVQPYGYQYQSGSQYQNQYQNQYQYLVYLMQLVQQLQRQLSELQGHNYGGGYDGNSEIEITTRSATDIDDDSARLRGDVDFNSSDYAYVWFEWGEDEDDLDEETSRIRRDDDEDEDFSARITHLDDDTKYYFRAVGEDEDDEKDYGSIRSFRTDDNGHSNNDDEPEVDTNRARDITDDSAELNGEVDMNDFDNGIVFFVWGQDENQIDDVEDDYDTYSDVDEDGDDLQKHRVDSNLDGHASYRLDVNGLDDNTDYYFAICIEYEDEDNDDVLSCGSTEDFETDN